jgi:maleate isomerase
LTTHDYIPSLERRKIGHITPSANTVLEPLTALISRPLDGQVSHHFTRIKVEAISLEPRHTEQFEPAPMLHAADLLSDAAVDAILWNGTSGGWNGIAADRELCAQISAQTGIPSSTTTLAQLEVLERAGISRAGLAVPYTDDVTAQIATTLQGVGIEIPAIANAGVSDNREMAFVSESTAQELVRRANSTDADCILLYCTGLAGAHIAERLEQELGKPVFDSVAVTLWKGLTMVGIEPRLSGWGSLLAGESADPSNSGDSPDAIDFRVSSSVRRVAGH